VTGWAGRVRAAWQARRAAEEASEALADDAAGLRWWLARENFTRAVFGMPPLTWEVVQARNAFAEDCEDHEELLDAGDPLARARNEELMAAATDAECRAGIHRFCRHRRDAGERPTPPDDRDYMFPYGWAGRQVGEVWGVVSPDGTVTAKGFTDHEGAQEDQAVYPVGTLVYYHPADGTWVHAATGRTVADQRRIDLERRQRAERSGAASTPAPSETTMPTQSAPATTADDHGLTPAELSARCADCNRPRSMHCRGCDTCWPGETCGLMCFDSEPYIPEDDDDDEDDEDDEGEGDASPYDPRTDSPLARQPGEHYDPTLLKLVDPQNPTGDPQVTPPPPGSGTTTGGTMSATTSTPTQGGGSGGGQSHVQQARANTQQAKERLNEARGAATQAAAKTQEAINLLRKAADGSSQEQYAQAIQLLSKLKADLDTAVQGLGQAPQTLDGIRF